MTPVIKNQPFSKLEIRNQKSEMPMTPAEVTRWLDESERAGYYRQLALIYTLAFWAVCAALLFVTIGFFTH